MALLISLRRAVRLHLGLLLRAEAEILIGGQAVLEGVMMRAPHSFAVAVRAPNGSLHTTQEKLVRPSERHGFWGWPVLRGLAVLGQAMVLGTKALRYSSAALEAGDAGPTPEAEAKAASAGTTAAIVFSLVFFVGFYKFLPLLAATALQRHFPALGGRILFNLTDGLIRIALFLLFISGLGLFADIRRVYEFHGAEHKVVFNYESGEPLTPANARRFSKHHPRCGTSFMLVIMLIAMVTYALVPATHFWSRFLSRIVLLPVIAGISFEIIRYAARHGRSLFALLARPGMWLQRITTREPDDEQLACAIRALETAMALERAQGGELVVA
ncbi:MAG: DUF1385 domain-containing protein [Terriglobales bacterium]